MLQGKQYKKEWSTKQKLGSLANTSLSTVTCRIAIFMRCIGFWALKIGFQLGMLHTPNLTKAQGQHQRIFALQCQSAKMAVRNSGDCYRPKSIKSATIRKIRKNMWKSTRVQFQNAVNTFADASISDGQMHVLFNQSSIYLMLNSHYFSCLEWHWQRFACCRLTWTLWLKCASFPAVISELE